MRPCRLPSDSLTDSNSIQAAWSAERRHPGRCWSVLVGARAASSAEAAHPGLSACCQPDNSSIPPSRWPYGDATLPGTVTEYEVLRAILMRPKGEIAIAKVDIQPGLAVVLAFCKGLTQLRHRIPG